MVYNFFDTKTSGDNTSGSTVKMKLISNQELAKECYQPIFKRFEKRKKHPSLMVNIWGSDLADVELISKFNKGIVFRKECVIDIFSK